MLQVRFAVLEAQAYVFFGSVENAAPSTTSSEELEHSYMPHSRPNRVIYRREFLKGPFLHVPDARRRKAPFKRLYF